MSRGIRFDLHRPAPVAPGAGTGPEPGWYPPAVDTAIATSPDGQWVLVRQGANVRLYDLAGEAAGAAPLSASGADIALVGPPLTAVVVEQLGVAADGTASETQVIALALPELGETARFRLDGAYALAATAGPRLALLAPTGALAVVRVAGRAFMPQPCDPGAPVELVAGIDKNHFLVVFAKRMELWDAASCRPVLRPNFTLPPAPRRMGALAGHAWCCQPGGRELVLYRLSDGRPFSHPTTAPIEAVIAHPAAPYLVVQTGGGLLRIHAFAHTAEWMTAPRAAAYAIGGGSALTGSATGASAYELMLVGAEETGAPWTQALVANATPPATEKPPTTSEVMEMARARRERGAATEPAPAPPPPRPRTAPVVRPAEAGAPPAAPAPRPRPAAAPVERGAAAAAPLPPAASASWREVLVELAVALRGKDAAAAEIPGLVLGTPLSELCQRAQLATPARRALTALYGVHLAGEPGLSIARLARLVGGDDGWREALGAGELAERGLVGGRAGVVAIAEPVARAIDGARPRAIEILGEGTPSFVAGPNRMDPASLGEPFAALEQALGRYALVTGAHAVGVLEAFVHGVTAVILPATGARLRSFRVPRGAGVIVVAARDALPPIMTTWPSLDPT